VDGGGLTDVSQFVERPQVQLTESGTTGADDHRASAHGQTDRQTDRTKNITSFFGGGNN